MNKIEALRERVRLSMERGEREVSMDPSDVVHLLSIAEDALNHKPDTAEGKARDFANYWLCRLDFPKNS